MPIDYTKRPTAAPAAPPAPPVSLTKVTLTKAAPTVSLTKDGGATGTLRVNLNWNARPGQSGGFLRRQQGGIDLDLGCLYEYADGAKGVVQALGKAFRDNRGAGLPPICWLDGDDRSGSNSGGENLYVDLHQLASIRRILVFAYIYEGVPSWATADSVVTLFPVGGPQVEVRLDEPDERSPMCAIALLENDGSGLAVRREVRYIRGSQQQLDQAYGWGMRWSAGRK